ncbi:hypothetical protein HPB47_006626 [Ixodes persulcatus]|uniref:Uncharacterized protein n=1 Tax=Ixodes persulcatus TaxID=34615 RepID=A0AC60PAB0_IXOPE|nr:hypothetical protein HPB47_006626 [Ixodes persulcatus]
MLLPWRYCQEAHSGSCVGHPAAPGDCVCERHFSPHLISRTYHVKHDGKVLLDAPKRSVLSTEAVPSNFPNCPNYRSASSKPPRKAPRKRPLVTHVSHSESTAAVDTTLPVEPVLTCCSDGPTPASWTLATNFKLPKSRALQTSQQYFKCSTTSKLAREAHKLASLDDETIASVAAKANLPEPQCHVLKACMGGSRQSKPGRKYTNHWILLCLLLLIRTPSRYRFLRENEVRPLPCVRIIRRYMFMVVFETGFDENVFAALKKKLPGKN